MKRVCAVGVVCLLAGCGHGASETPTNPGSTIAVSHSDLAFCVTETNRYRAMAGQPALLQSSDVEAFALAAAQGDKSSGIPHSYYESHAFGFSAENEILQQSQDFFGKTGRDAFANAIAAFWSEGPAGGHYRNMVGPYTQVGCAAIADSTAWTIVQEFR